MRHRRRRLRRIRRHRIRVHNAMAGIVTFALRITGTGQEVVTENGVTRCKPGRVRVSPRRVGAWCTLEELFGHVMGEM